MPSLEILNLTTLDKLRGLEALLADKRRWTRGTYARRSDGFPTREFNADATCWCLVGASRLLGIEDSALQRSLNLASPTAWNDTRSHTAIMRVIRRAIEIEEGRS